MHVCYFTELFFNIMLQNNTLFATIGFFLCTVLNNVLVLLNMM